MKTVTAHLLEFTLTHYCASNKSELARKLGMRRNDFSRIYDRCMAGEGSSLTALEAMLKLYCSEGYSLDDALRGYIAEAIPASYEMPVRMCKEYPRLLRERLSSQSKAADQQAQISRSAEQFLAQVERAFCTEACALKHSEDDECPCQQLCRMVERLLSQMNNGIPG